MELLERVKKVCPECYKLREEGIKESKPVQLLNKLVHQETEEETVKLLDEVGWEDVFVLQDVNELPSKSNPPEFKFSPGLA